MCPASHSYQKGVWPPSLTCHCPLGVQRSCSELVAVIGRSLFVAWSLQAARQKPAPAGTLQCPIGNSLFVIQLPSVFSPDLVLHIGHVRQLAELP